MRLSIHSFDQGQKIARLQCHRGSSRYFFLFSSLTLADYWRSHSSSNFIFELVTHLYCLISGSPPDLFVLD